MLGFYKLKETVQIKVRKLINFPLRRLKLILYMSDNIGQYIHYSNFEM